MSATLDQIPLWLDCDPGHDDAFAILLAAYHPFLKLLGISTVHGNVSLHSTTKNASSVLEAIGRPDIPVHPGANKPYCRPAVYAEYIHGETGLDGTTLLPKPTQPYVRDPPAIIAMRDALLAQPAHTAWVVATGTLTNVALLFAAFPDVAEHVAGLSIMGASVGNGFTPVPISRKPGDEKRTGNITPYAEFNVYCDPEAAQSIVSSPVLAPKTVFASLDLTHQVLATPNVQASILHSRDHPDSEPTILRRILHDLVNFFGSTYESVYGLSYPPLHDPVAVAVLLSNINTHGLASSLIHFDDHDGQRFLVDVVTDGKHSTDPTVSGRVGQTLVRPVEGQGKGIAIPRSVDVAAFWQVITDVIERADAHKMREKC